ncbi:MAG: LacI family DNA-binding transcriptional regulator [Phycisphaerae bacterium]
MSIIEVAQKAGVSPSTVSRVMNDHPRVAQETARAVRKVMAELGYVPSDTTMPAPITSSCTEACKVRSAG